MSSKLKSEIGQIISYLTLRRVIGILGLLLPFILSIGAWIVFNKGIQSSVSAYYYTGMRNVFVGILFTIGFFLLSYRGYDPIDNIVGNFGFVFAVCVAIFPTAPDGLVSNLQKVLGTVHLISASLFFLTLILFSLFLFTKTNKDKSLMTRQKKGRNVIYLVCGGLMSVCMLLIVVYALLPEHTISSVAGYNPVYWLEAMAIVAFGVSWIVKGETFMRDRV